MPRHNIHRTRNVVRPVARRDAKRPDEQWTVAEQTSGETEAAAQHLITRAGSRERAKQAVDAVDEGHPP